MAPGHDSGGEILKDLLCDLSRKFADPHSSIRSMSVRVGDFSHYSLLPKDLMVVCARNSVMDIQFYHMVFGELTVF